MEQPISKHSFTPLLAIELFEERAYSERPVSRKQERFFENRIISANENINLAVLLVSTTKRLVSPTDVVLEEPINNPTPTNVGERCKRNMNLTKSWQSRYRMTMELRNKCGDKSCKQEDIKNC